MKRILLLAAMLLGTVATYAQTDDYIPLVREGSEWCYHGNFLGPSDGKWTGTEFTFYTISGDSTITGVTYKKVLMKRVFMIENDNGELSICYVDDVPSIPALVREEDKRVYTYNLKGYGFPVSGFGIPTEWFDDGITKLTMLYDFNDIGQYMHDIWDDVPSNKSKNIYVEGTDANLCGNNKCYVLTDGDQCVVEGIGEYTHSWRNGNFLWRPKGLGLTTTEWREKFVYMKNPQGEFEYCDQEEYSKIKHLFESPSAITDVKVPTRPTDDRYYNLMGQPVAHPENAPGIYIHNGKKVVVK